MDVSAVLAAQTSKYKSITVQKDIALESDAGLMTVTDPNAIDSEQYQYVSHPLTHTHRSHIIQNNRSNLEEHLQSLARDGVQHLLTSIFSLPTNSSPDGPLAILPPPTTHLPRSKPLPKPKPQTKWQKFANQKGIQHRKRENVVFDEEKQKWVRRWGKDGKNKDEEEQWIHEVPDNAPDDYNPVSEARKKRKERVAKNEKQRLQNLVHNSAQESRKAELQKTLATTRTSTASLGKFDKKLDGESKLRGVKRKFLPNEQTNETERSLAILSKLNSQESIKKKLKRGDTENSTDILNVRKAVKVASGGKGRPIIPET
ncbi:Rhodanese- sulfurtransferase [Tulasnella sp. 419]|nr:Rhodanese- sulfurtransferase [Tulasnella sp. 419]